MTDGIDKRLGRLGDLTKVVGESENRPGVRDRAVVGIRGVGKSGIVDEPPADDRVLASLPGYTLRLKSSVSQSKGFLCS